VNHFTGNRNWFIAAAVTVAAIAMSATLGARGSAELFTGLVGEVIFRGPESRLPAHLSVVLGISAAERETAVRQAVIRDGQIVHTFNVCSAKPDDVVMMSVNEREHSTKAYLASAAGVLRKAVSYGEGAPANERSLTEARGDFAKEIKLWTDFERKSAGPK
jgi:hypothetical protein